MLEFAVLRGLIIYFLALSRLEGEVASKKLGEPKARAFLEAVAQLPTEANLAECKPVGPMGLLSACRSCEVKEGLGVIVELTKTMAKIKTLAPVESA